MLESEKIIVQAPMSFTGSARRIWRLTPNENDWWQMALQVLAVALIALAWTAVLAWYVLFGLLLVPYRLIRRGARKNKRDELRHREMLAASGPASTELQTVPREDPRASAHP